MAKIQILKGHVSALFAFDIGYEVSLEKLSAVFPSVPIQPLSQKKRTPIFLQYARPPHILDLGACDGLESKGQVQATVFDFGVVSISYKWPLALPEQDLALEDLPALSQRLYNLSLADDARKRVRTLIEKAEPAIKRPALSEMVEDYYLFVIEKLNPMLPADEMVEQRAIFTQTLRFETRPLSLEQQQDALSQKLSYYDSDLLLVDWNAAIVYDEDYEDTVSVLELLNVELLEARYIDFELDRRIQEYAQLVQSHKELPLPFRTPFRPAVRDLTELRVESALLAERVGNSLKLIGDLYLARVYAIAAERFHLHEWEKIVAQKLDMIDQFYQLVTDRVRTAQSQTLELAVIILILVELFLAIFK